MMIIELQAVVVGVFANIVGDQILIMLLGSALHIWSRHRCENSLDCDRLSAPVEALELPATGGLLPADAV